MNQDSSKKPWAKLVAIDPDDQNIALYTEGNQEDLFEKKLTISQNQDGEVFLKNISTSSLSFSLDYSFLGINQEKRLFGGEKLWLDGTNYVFCFTNFQSRPLKRNRDETTESHQNLQKLAKIEADLPKELTCSICTNLLQKCMSLNPCQHTFCSSCLFYHLKSSTKCPLCRVKAVYVAKNPILSNIIQLTVDNSPILQRSQETRELLEQIDFSGKIVRNEEGTYIGSFFAGKKNGQGKMIYNDGRIYEGSWRQGQREGKGVQVYANGGRYDGYWKNNEKHGTGKFVWAHGQEYEGDYQDSNRHGFGTMKFPDGRVYRGDWRDGLKEGKGFLTFPNGDKYEGEWVDDTLQAQVPIEYSNGEKYQGGISVRDFERHGKGILILNNGDKCHGTWMNNVLQPQVKIEYDNGEKYLGEIQTENFKKHGRGVFTFNNGDSFTGNWVDDKQHGYGKEISRSGKRIFEGVWKEGRISGDIIMTDEDGVQYEAELKRLEGERRKDLWSERIEVKEEADFFEATENTPTDLRCAFT